MTEQKQTQADLLLPALRIARRRLRYISDEIDAMGIMLSAGGISIGEALGWMDALGITSYVGDLTIRSFVPDETEQMPEYDPFGFPIMEAIPEIGESSVGG